MPEASSDADPISHVRRHQRAVNDDAWIRSYLKEAPFGVLATEHDGQPFLTPLNFAYDEDSHAIYFHAARTGRLFTNVAANPRTCFNACQMGSLISGPHACAFDVEYHSVIVFGQARVLDSSKDATRGLHLLVDKYSPRPRQAADRKPFSPSDLATSARLSWGYVSGISIIFTHACPRSLSRTSLEKSEFTSGMAR